jgi:hypothetical protein
VSLNLNGLHSLKGLTIQLSFSGDWALFAAFFVTNTTKLTQFAAAYKEFPPSIKVHYEMKTEKQIVAVYPAGSGATLETFHKLIFSKN